MGFFDWLKGEKGKVEVANDRVWLSQQAKSDGIRREINEALADPTGPCAIVAVAHFEDCLNQLRSVVADFDQDRFLVTLADALSGREPADVVTDESRSILIVVGERHPLRSHDDVILNFARSLPCRCRVVHHLSLEDGVMMCFAGEWLEGVLRRMGMKDDEVISSRMISRRIRLAQDKIANAATSDPPAASADEWFQVNSIGHQQR